MRGATDCARRLKQLFGTLRSKLGRGARPPAGDALTQMILAILSRDTPEARAAEGLDRLRAMVVDYNELRVIPPIELAELLSDFFDARLKCEDISRSLNRIFALEHTISLDRLSRMSRKDMAAYLERIDGLEPYTRARVLLLGFHQHAIPLDEAMWALARRDRIVDPRCPLDEAQRFLERHIAEEDALEFFLLFRKHAWGEMGTAVKKRAVARIVSVPPDRTSRNMLQMVAASAADVAGEALLDDAAEPQLPEPDAGEEATLRSAESAAAEGAPRPTARRATGTVARQRRAGRDGARAANRVRAAGSAGRAGAGGTRSGASRAGKAARRRQPASRRS